MIGSIELDDMKSTRFDLLDGLRGVAAVAVMIYHYTQHNGLRWLSGAWVAVDLFFILSGFVIAHSYGTKIADGLSFRQFALIRLIRLGPLYFLGLAIGLVAVMLTIANSALPQVTGNQALMAFSLGLAGLPYLNDGHWPFGTASIGGAIFPLNDPAWSLFFELFVNALFFLALTRFRQISNQKIVLFASIVFLLCTVVFRQINPGWGTLNFVFAFPRVIAEFFAGALVYSMGLYLKRFKIGTVLTVSALSIFCFALENPRLALLNSITLIPLTVILMSTVRIKGVAKSVCKILGEISYPLYILHVPIYRLIFELTEIKSMPAILQTVIAGAVCIAVSLMLATVDLRARKWLMMRLVATKSTVATQS